MIVAGNSMESPSKSNIKKKYHKEEQLGAYQPNNVLEKRHILSPTLRDLKIKNYYLTNKSNKKIIDSIQRHWIWKDKNVNPQNI